MIHYPIPPHLQAAYTELNYGKNAFPIAENIHNNVLSLPIAPHLSQTSQETIIATIKTATTV